MSKEYDFLVFIGRFQPFHNGHAAVIEAALAAAHKVIVLVGSAHRPRCPRNPWLYAERLAMIQAALPATAHERVIIAPIMDATYNEDLWLATTGQCVAGLVAAHHSQPHRAPRIGLVGHAKDHTSYYLKCFPQWSSLDVPVSAVADGTAIRAQLFNAQLPNAINALADLVPTGVALYLKDWIQTPAYKDVQQEHAFVARYRSAWDSAPYQPTFVTVDAVVVQSGHVLLVERGARPGKGLWALPGGFLDPHETLQAAMLRELKEETRIKVPVPVLQGSIRGQDVFDDPHRSARGRTITHAFYIHLSPDTTLPKVRGSDDAKRAFWAPLADLDPSKFFEDHYFIVQRLVGQMT